MKEMMGKSQDAYPQVAGTQSTARPAQRSKITDVDGIQHALQVAALTLLPDEVSGRALINRLMPQLYQLRKKGFSYKALTRVINDAIGDPTAKLQPSTVKTYYNEFLVERLDDCQAQLKETMQVISQIDKHSARSTQELVAEGIKVRSTMATATGHTADAATQRILSGQNSRVAIKATTDLASVATPQMKRPAAIGPPTASGSLVCTATPDDGMQHPTTNELFDNNPPEFFSEAQLEHPAIPGMMLSRPQRFYKSRLEYQNNGAEQMETGQQMAARFSWKKSKKVAESRTQNSFVAMDTSLFAASK